MMDIEEFKEMYERFCRSHVQASEEGLAKDPKFEIEDPRMFFFSKIDGVLSIDSFSEELNKLPMEVRIPLVRGLLAAMREQPGEELAQYFKDTKTGESPKHVEIVGFGVSSEGWEKDPVTMARTREVSFVTVEDTDYHVGMAAWTKDIENAKLVNIRDDVIVAKHDGSDVGGRLMNMFQLEPREEVQRAN